MNVILFFMRFITLKFYVCTMLMLYFESWRWEVEPNTVVVEKRRAFFIADYTYASEGQAVSGGSLNDVGENRLTSLRRISGREAFRKSFLFRWWWGWNCQPSLVD